MLPSQTQILLPLLEVLDENGPMRTKDACDAVAERMEIPADVRKMRAGLCADGQEPLLLDRRIRWTRQTAVLAGLMDPSQRAKWALTSDGRKTHRFAKPGVVVTVCQNDLGAVLWAEFRSAQQFIERGSVTTCLTSPPFPLCNQRSYAKDMPEWAPENYVNTLLDEIGRIRPLLARDGSLVLNLGPTFLPGKGCRNPYQHQLIARLVDNLGWSLVDEHTWINPSKPRTSPHVTKARTHCVNGVEQFYILSPTGATKCSNWRVLNPYSERQKRLIARGGEVVTEAQPSKVQTPGRRFFAENGGAIPFNVHTYAPDADIEYRKYCAARGLQQHAAMMPMKLCEFFVEFTSEVNDLILEPFGGSLKVGAAAFKLDRRCIITERCLGHIQGGLSRFQPYDLRVSA